IAAVMVPSFNHQVVPNGANVVRDSYYAVPAIHATLGSAAELLGLDGALVATGSRIVPVRLRFRNYRAWMRTTLVLWWITIGVGVGTYVVWYMLDEPPAASPTGPA